MTQYPASIEAGVKKVKDAIEEMENPKEVIAHVTLDLFDIWADLPMPERGRALARLSPESRVLVALWDDSFQAFLARPG